MKHVECAVCRETSDPVASEGGPASMERTQICPLCGVFTVSHAFTRLASEVISRADLGRLHGVLHRFALANPSKIFPVVLDPDNYRQVLATHGVPRDHNERFDSVLRLVADLAPRYGQWTEPKTLPWWAARLYTLDSDEAEQLLLEHGEWLLFERARPDFWHARLTREGWLRLRELQESRSEARSLFLANWAHPAVRGPVERAGATAAAEVGLSLEVGNALAESRKIDDSIVAAIRRARVVVADFTGARGGVYYEAGFAAGLNVPVVYTCHREWSAFVLEDPPHDARGVPVPPLVVRPWQDDRHFDVEHYPFVFWADEAGLHRSIVERVRAWGYALPGHT